MCLQGLQSVIKTLYRKLFRRVSFANTIYLFNVNKGLYFVKQIEIYNLFWNAVYGLFCLILFLMKFVHLLTICNS